MMGIETTTTGSSVLRDRQRENTELNLKEWREGRETLESTPQRVFLQVNAPCNADCVFCSKGYDYPPFSFDDYAQGLGRKLTPVLSRCREMILSGSGELLGLPDAGKLLEYFNGRFPHVDKFIATNASHADRRLWELIAGSESRYTLQLSLHSSDEASHRLMTRTKLYGRVMENVRYLAERRRETGNPSLHLMFVMTTLNAEKLPDFVRLGAELGVDRVTAGYFYVYEAQQKYLSLYFKPDLANRAIDEARKVADELGVKIELPHKFGAKRTSSDHIGSNALPEGAECGAPPGAPCPEPWTQTMVSVDGRVLPCDVYGDFKGDLGEREFVDIWNGAEYRELRRAAARGEGCFKTCPRQNAGAIDSWEAHVIDRHKGDAAILKEYREAMRRP